MARWILSQLSLSSGFAADAGNDAVALPAAGNFQALLQSPRFDKDLPPAGSPDVVMDAGNDPPSPGRGGVHQ